MFVVNVTAEETEVQTAKNLDLRRERWCFMDEGYDHVMFSWEMSFLSVLESF